MENDSYDDDDMVVDPFNVDFELDDRYVEFVEEGDQQY